MIFSSKSTIEHLAGAWKKKVAVVGHSMGNNVFLYFLRWVESPLGGNGGPSWTENYVDTFMNIGGPLLGVPKTMSTLVSGEMKDTAELNAVLQYIKENLLSKEDLVKIFRSFGSLPSMVPIGVINNTSTHFRWR